MTQIITPISSLQVATPAAAPTQGKFQRFCDWVGDHKREIAVAMLIIGVACFAFGTASVLSIMPISNFYNTIAVVSFLVGLFTFDSHGWITGLTTTGFLFFIGIGAVIMGGILIGFGSGVLVGSSKKEAPKATPQIEVNSTLDSKPTDTP
jgi:hypothetical protein